jgi:uncharacterized membrane protein YgdD (TMEM256/DUF423 family)
MLSAQFSRGTTFANTSRTVYDTADFHPDTPMNLWLLIAASNGALAVAAGAFGAHGLEGRLDAHQMEVFQTAARYHMYHALAIGLAALAARAGAASTQANAAAAFFLAGIILFSGSLYLLSLTGIRALGFVTPFGGLAFLVGWIALAWAAVRVG